MNLGTCFWRRSKTMQKSLALLGSLSRSTMSGIKSSQKSKQAKSFLKKPSPTSIRLCKAAPTCLVLSTKKLLKPGLKRVALEQILLSLIFATSCKRIARTTWTSVSTLCNSWQLTTCVMKMASSTWTLASRKSVAPRAANFPGVKNRESPSLALWSRTRVFLF